CVITYPKAGTTWTQEIVWLVCNEADTEMAKTTNLEDRFPCLELPVPGIKTIAKSPSPRFIKTHLPHGVCPPDIWRKGAKVVYTTRNPKDVSVSVYHFLRLLTATNFKGTFSQFFPLFADKWAIYGGFWYHVLGFWKRRDEPNILFMTYEEMLQDTPKAIRKIASYLEKDLTDEQVRKIAFHCSFDQMKNNPSANMSWMQETGVWKNNEFTNNGGLMRKGKVGDWRNHYTQVQSEEVDRLNREILEPHDLSFVYDL
ncbi:PREDICTED: sulfotransferase family cytosolic 1B member 1-like, partial [Priapulus caudatus]|uniref:Sulfotransferase family cytosolic 1B member 1-like n=1 Tax=Priapulus caudatus TaxID=37621 RepID=A0ABM1E0L6_PRICU